MSFVSREIIEDHANAGELAHVMKIFLGEGIRKKALTPERLTIMRDDPYSVYGAIPCLSDRLDLFVTKIATLVTQKNRSPVDNKDTVQGYVTAFSVKTGQPLGIFDGAAITDLKCAAITALMTDLCSKKSSKSLGLIGTGAVAYQQLKGIATIRDIDDISIYGRNSEKVALFIEKIRPLFNKKCSISNVDSPRMAALNRDIVCTATSTYEPLLTEHVFTDHTHINCLGSHTPNSREISHDILAAQTLIVEDRQTAEKEAGELHHRAFELEDIIGDETLIDELKNKNTIFSSVGHGILDTIVVKYLLDSGIRP